ncbi:hypothetical protein LJ737_08250 [Hymenobacter sp. 15J16-1T3B]|uniref:DUF2268 domain-containing putative Zn-dependent protease n=1 Tax=Hymenobacter sp. 15J16-1T3B TaxID=2886941 RepID=UPI001D1169F8|nr:hypothetical protein [Hymenobacter sp. 15J16-1T3B]MCC3157226.1 hypothetical protein [Hymenobacter sp. 15J16-1T3B]
MMRLKQLTLGGLLVAGALPAAAQRPAPQTVFTDDVDRFWQAYDSVRSTAEPARQVAAMNRLYVAKGSEGLRAFMKARGYSAEEWVRQINQYPKFWDSVRPNTLSVKTKTAEIERSVQRLRRLYPELRDGKMYFTVGGMRSGGTVDGNLVLIGTEIATGTAQTDVSELPGKWLATVFAQQRLDNVVALNVHEYVHTQQRSEGATLLAEALREGACDFVAELATGQPEQSAYSTYGRAHEPELRTAFKQEMFGADTRRWLYNGTKAATVADLGYYMGYAIHKAYYQRAKNKRQAVKDIIELDYTDAAAVDAFLTMSGYYPEGWDKAALLTALDARRPVLLQVLPFANGATTVDAALTELVLRFDRAMSPTGMAFEPTARGKEFFPLKKPLGFSPDGQRFTLQVELQPNHEYEFVVSPRGFVSQDGFPLREAYTVRFKTR